MIGDTASISLLTGLPGAGKSLRLAEAISKLVDKGEHVYACNIEGLRIKGVTKWEDACNWRDLPTGAILFVDEAQDFFPERRGGSPPDEVRMNRIRHDGIRLVLATQQPNYLDTYLRGLVGYHEHLLRRDGRQESFIFSDNHVMDVVRKPIKVIKRNYDYTTYKFNPKYFECYDSAQVHTVKYRMPHLVRRALMIAPIAAVLGFGAWYTVFRDTHWAQEGEAQAAEKTAPPGPALAAGAAPTLGGSGLSRNPGNTATTLRTDDELDVMRQAYVQSLVPLVDGYPWSAPAFVGRPVVSEPGLFCSRALPGETETGYVDTDDCVCTTEQGTRTFTTRQACETIARWGEPYNPHKAPLRSAEAAPADEGAGAGQVPARAATAALSIGEKDRLPQYGQFRDDPPGPQRYELGAW